MSVAARLVPLRRSGKSRNLRARTGRPGLAGGTDPARRLGLTAAVAAAVALTAIVAAVLMARPTAAVVAAAGPAPSGAAEPGTASANAASALTGRGTADGSGAAIAGTAAAGNSADIDGMAASGSPAAATRTAVSGRTAAGLARPAASGRPAAVSLVLTAADQRDCPAAATACVDLTRHITWLQAGRKVTFGPVQMEPGKPGGGHVTPPGTFHVAWKAGPSYMSTTYHEAMPWATFFAAGGIAFHGGSLTEWSHGCVHLTDSNAHYYNEHLPIGAEVVVF
jgi:lipoprotein-anchoring transpeptidase ErfK/SrfK